MVSSREGGSAVIRDILLILLVLFLEYALVGSLEARIG